MHNISQSSHSPTHQTGSAAAAALRAGDEYAGAAAAGGSPITARETRKALPSNREQGHLMQIEEDFEACAQAIEAKNTALSQSHLEVLVNSVSKGTRTLADELAALPEFYVDCIAEDVRFEPGYNSENYPHGLTEETIFNKCFNPNQTDQTVINLDDPAVIFYIFDRYGYLPSQIPTEYEYMFEEHKFTRDYRGAIDTNFVRGCKYIDEQIQITPPVTEIDVRQFGGQRLGPDDNSFKILPPLIGQLSGLHELSLNSHTILRIPHEISQLTNLRDLALVTFTLRSIPNSLHRLTQLRGLCLRHNQLPIFPPFIDSFQQLEYIMLDINNLTSVPSSLASCKTLERLYLSNNPLQAFDSTLLQLPALTVLDVSNCEITHLPEGMIEMQSLSRLRATGSPLDPQSQAMVDFFTQNYFRLECRDAFRTQNVHSVIPETMMGLPAFNREHDALNAFFDQCCPVDVTFPADYSKQRILAACFGTDGPSRLGDNGPPGIMSNDMRIAHFAARFGCLPSQIPEDQIPFMTQNFVDSCVLIDRLKDDPETTELNLSGRGLIILPPNIGDLKHVTHLDLSNNQLIYLPDEIGDCTGLEVLNLHSNALPGLPPSIGRLSALQQLGLSYNQISALPREIQDLVRLEKIDLRDNPLYFLSR